MAENQATLKGKLKFTGTITLTTGMHIGTGSDFSPIGAIDSFFIRDTMTHIPIIPGSSLKGKLRTLLAKSRSETYILNQIEDDDWVVSRLFGSAKSKAVRPARLQFYDLFMAKDSIEFFSKLDTDTYIGEIKAENTINRLSSEANPRFIERVPAGARFDFKLIYNIENVAEEKTADEVEEDLRTLKDGLDPLTYDYLGGNGSRGYGRISISDISVKLVGIRNKNTDDLDIELYNDIFKDMEGRDA